MAKGYVIAHFKFKNLDAFMAGYGTKIDGVISQFEIGRAQVWEGVWSAVFPFSMERQRR